MDPFSTLGLPRSYAVDSAALERRHRELSRALHPDKYAGTGASERLAALGKAVEVNEAFRVVRDPVRRAEALFRLAGVEVGETKEPKPSGAFLMEVLEEREALAEAKATRDAEAIAKLAGQVLARQKEAEARLSRGFAETTERDALAALVPTLGELRFFRRFLEEVSAIEDELHETAQSTKNDG